MKAEKPQPDQFDEVLRKMLATPPQPKVAKKATPVKKSGRKKR